MSRRPGNSVVTTNDKPGGIGRSSYEIKDKFSYHDKESGNYGRVTTKDSMSSGDFVNRGQFGYKDEYKTSFNVRVGDKRGYTVYSREERVKYDDSSNNSWGGTGRSISSGCNGYNDYDGNNDNYGGGGGNNSNDDGNDNNNNINAPYADDDALHENDDDDGVDSEANSDDDDCGVGHDACYDDDDDDNCGVDDDACYDDDHDDDCGVDDDACYDDDHDGDFDGDAFCVDWGY